MMGFRSATPRSASQITANSLGSACVSRVTNSGAKRSSTGTSARAAGTRSGESGLLALNIVRNWGSAQRRYGSSLRIRSGTSTILAVPRECTYLPAGIAPLHSYAAQESRPIRTAPMRIRLPVQLRGRLQDVPMLSWGFLREGRGANQRMLDHSKKEGRFRTVGWRAQPAERSASSNSALPRLVSFCLRVSQARKEGTR